MPAHPQDLVQESSQICDMKIIKAGVDPRVKEESPWWDGLEAECGRCHTVIRVDELDAPAGFWGRDVDDTTGVIKQIRLACPVCRTQISIPRPVATTSVQKFAETRQRLLDKEAGLCDTTTV